MGICEFVHGKSADSDTGTCGVLTYDIDIDIDEL